MNNVLVIGQAMPRTDPSRPFGRTALYAWLESAGINEETIKERFTFGAVVDYFPGSRKGSHLAPTGKQILEAHPRLERLIADATPQVVVPVGTVAIREVLSDPGMLMRDAVGKSFDVDPLGALGRTVAVIPLPHPSGASPWVNIGNNRSLLDEALGLLAKNLAA